MRQRGISVKFKDRSLQYQTKKTDFYHLLEDTEKRGNRSKKLERKFVGTENKIKDIMPTNTQNKNNAIRKVHKVNMSL